MKVILTDFDLISETTEYSHALAKNKRKKSQIGLFHTSLAKCIFHGYIVYIVKKGRNYL